MTMVYTWVQERQLKFDEYRDLATRLVIWLRENTGVMLDRNFPSTLIEMKVRISAITVVTWQGGVGGGANGIEKDPKINIRFKCIISNIFLLNPY